jgi:hypothetical protein
MLSHELFAACAWHDSLHARAALTRIQIKEGEVMLNRLRQEASFADSLVEEASKYIGYVREHLHRNNISELSLSDNEEAELPPHTSDVNSDTPQLSFDEITAHSLSDADDSDDEAADRRPPSPKVSSPGSAPLTEVALKELQAGLCE